MFPLVAPFKSFQHHEAEAMRECHGLSVVDFNFTRGRTHIPPE
jgi:hypothetical protein